MEQHQSELDGRNALRITGLLENAYSDYISSRILFNADKLREACIMANQCLEKQMKAYIEARYNKENTSHDTLKLLNTMVYLKFTIADKINKDFVRVLNKIYKTRYYEQLSGNYNHTIVQYKFLAELDYIMYEFLPLITIMSKGISPYNRDKQAKSETLFLNNYILNNISKSDFLAQVQLVEEFILHGHNTIVFKSQINAALDNGKFIYSGAKIITPTKALLTDWSLEEFGKSKSR